MRRMILILLLVLFSFWQLAAAFPGNDPESSQKLKHMLDNVSNAIVKVVAEAGKVYVGTGIALEPDMVLTSALLVRNPAARLVVVRMDESRFPARLKGRDPRTALALLQLESPVLTPIPRANSVEVGDWIALVGAFYDRFPAVQQGVVSSVSHDAVILNAAAVPGSSGGAVLNADGRLVAVMRGRFGYGTTPDIRIESESGDMTFLGRKFHSNDLSYAIPVVRLGELADKLKRFGHVPRAWAGLRLKTEGNDRALRIAGVQPGSPAERAGLLLHDRILAINGRDVVTVGDVMRTLRGLVPGDTLRLDIERDNLRKGILLTLEEGPQQNAGIAGSDVDFDMAAFDDFSDNLPVFRRFLLQAGKDGSRLPGDLRERVREMAVSVHHRSLEPIRRRLRRLAWQADLMENRMETIKSVNLEHMQAELKELEQQTRKSLKARQLQLEEDRRNLTADLQRIRKRIEALEKDSKK